MITLDLTSALRTYGSADLHTLLTRLADERVVTFTGHDGYSTTGTLRVHPYDAGLVDGTTGFTLAVRSATTTTVTVDLRDDTIPALNSHHAQDGDTLTVHPA